MAKKALVVYGGWEGHEPEMVAEIYNDLLTKEGFEVEMSDTLDAYNDKEKLLALDLIVPHFTVNDITQQQLESVLNAVASGVGLAGCHGGMCDAFHDSVDWHFMTGGQWVAHPGFDYVEYKVEIKKGSSPIVDGLEDFTITTEQYYMHVDPAVNVLATTHIPPGKPPYIAQNIVELEPSSGIGTWNLETGAEFTGPHVGNKEVDMPVAWTKVFGAGRVFYSSLGHTAKTVREKPVLELLRRGLLWAAK